MMKKFSSLIKALSILLIQMTLCQATYSQWIINEGFEGGIPSNWTVYDANNDGDRWMALQHANAHSGSKMAFVQSYSGNGNDWLVTPQISVQQGYVFTFFARSWTSTERMVVLLSTSGNSINKFTTTLADIQNLGNTYQEFTFDLSAYSGRNIYLAIRWIQNTYAMMVDDVKIGTPPSSDIGVLSIESPKTIEMIGNQMIPCGIIKNFSEVNTDNPFNISCIIKDSINNVVFSDTYNYSASLLSLQIDTVTFNTWSPQYEGNYNVTFYTSLPNDGNTANDTLTRQFKMVTHYGTGGPDLMGYRWIDNTVTGGPAFNWIDISSTGTSTIMYGVNAFHGDDNFSESIPIGFSFPFYGINRSYFYADINGELLLTQNNWTKPFPNNGWNNDGNPYNYYTTIPGYTEMPALISVFWDDLYADSGVSDVFFQTMGTSPNRYCVIQWNNLRFVAGSGGSPSLCFQVILHENGDIVMQYQNLENGQTGGNNPHVNGQSATVAIQNDDASSGLTYLTEIVTDNQYLGYYPEGNLLQNGTAIRFYPGEDTQAPIISHDKVWNTFNNFMELEAQITDISHILYDTLYYNYGTGWLSTTHQSIVEPNTYKYLIDNMPLGNTVEYYFVAIDSSANANRAVLDNIEGIPLSFDVLPTQDANVLLLMPGNVPGFQDFRNTEFPKYIMALDSLNVNYDVYNWAAYDSYSFPDNYDIIIAYSNSTGNSIIHDTLSKAIINFLDEGTLINPKNIFFASDDFASAQHGLANDRIMKKLFTAYIRGAYNVQPNPPVYGGDNGIGGPDYIGYAYGSIKGLPETPIGSEGIEYEVYADDPDVLLTRNCPEWYANEVQNPEISSNYAFCFEDGPINGNAYSKGNGSAIWLNNLIYKSFFISFDISQFTSDSDIIELLSDALEWFTPEIMAISLMASPEEGGTVTGSGNYQIGTTASVSAVSNIGFSFENWTENGNIVSYNSNYSFVVIESRNLIANFSLNNYEVTASVNPDNSGSVTGTGSYNYGAACTLTASPNDNYVFVNWTENGVVVSEDESYSFTVQEADHFVANFIFVDGIEELKDKIISIFPNPTDGNVYIHCEEEVDIVVMDIFGRIFEKINNQNQDDFLVDLNHLPQGIYYIKTINGNKITINKIIKM